MKNSLAVALLLVTLTSSAQEEAVMTAVAEPKGIETFQENGLIGLIDHDENKILLKPVYQNIKELSFSKSLRLVYKDSMASVIDIMSGEEFLKDSYYELTERPATLNGKKELVFLAKKKADATHSLMGIVTLKGEILVPVDFSDIGSFNYLPYVLVKKDSLFTIYNVKEKKAMNVLYKDIQFLSIKAQMAWAAKNGKGGIIDLKGKMISPFIYTRFSYTQSAWDDRNDILEQMKMNKTPRKEFFILRTTDGKSSILDVNRSYDRKLPVFDSIVSRYQGYFIVESNKKKGLVNLASQVIIPLKYNHLEFEAVNDSAIVVLAEKNKKHGVFSLKGETICELNYKAAASLHNNRFRLCKDQKYALGDMQANLLTGFDYDYIGSFTFNRAAVISGGKLGYIDSTGKVVEAPSKNIVPQGFREIDSLFYQGFKALRSGDDSALYRFARLACPDEFSKDYFERTHCSIRGFPKKLATENKTVQNYYESYYTRLKELRKELKRYGNIEQMEFVGSGGKGFGFVRYCFSGEIFRGTENQVVVKLNDKFYSIKLGEVFRIDGYWKSFTNPRVFEGLP